MKRPRYSGFFLVITLTVLFILWLVSATKPYWTRQALIGAVTRGNLDEVRVLLERGADPNTYVYHSKRHRKTIIMLAAEKGEFEIVRTLHERGANLLETDVTGDNILFFIINVEKKTTGHYQCLEYLSNVPALVNMKNDQEETPLLFSVILDQKPEYIKCLICNGADVDHIHPVYGSLLFMLAADSLKQPAAIERRKLEIARILIAAGAPVNWTNDDGLVASEIAAQRGRDELARLLQEAEKGDDGKGK